MTAQAGGNEKKSGRKDVNLLGLMVESAEYCPPRPKFLQLNFLRVYFVLELDDLSTNEQGG